MYVPKIMRTKFEGCTRKGLTVHSKLYLLEIESNRLDHALVYLGFPKMDITLRCLHTQIQKC